MERKLESLRCDSMILITGCAGYIGQHLAKELLESGMQVRGFVLPGQEELMQELVEASLELYTGDIRNKYDLEQAINGVDFVYSLTGLHSTVERMREIYVEGTRNLLHLCSTYRVEKVILASSGAVYGNCMDELITEEHLWNREHPFSQVNCEMEEIIQHYYLKENLNVIILRIAEVYGDGKFNFFHKKISEQTQVIGSPDTYNSRIFIGDLVQILKMALSQLEAGEAYNVTDNNAATLQEYYEELGMAIPKWIDVSSVPDRIKRSIHGLRSNSIRMSNKKLMTKLSYTFELPTYKEGIAYCRQRIDV